MERAAGLYIHVPFCREICPYCDFTVVRPRTGQGRSFVNALGMRIAREGTRGPFAGRRLESVYFGGGTPSLLPPAGLGTLLDTIRDSFEVAADAEISLEANPESATRRRIDAWLEAGIDRVSVGVQALDRTSLRTLGRSHDRARALAALEDLERAGVGHLCADLIAGIPGQSAADWAAGVERVIASGVTHLSIYCLTAHPDTPLGERVARGEIAIDEDEQADRYQQGVALAAAHGLARYEVANLAAPGQRSRHNLLYWTQGDWLGLGPGACSHLQGRRWRESANLRHHLSPGSVPRDQEEVLELRQRQLETIMLGLRLEEGIDPREFEGLGGGSLEATVPDTLAQLIAARAISRSGGPERRWRLHGRHLLLADAYAERFAREILA